MIGLAPSVLIGEHLSGLKKMMNKWVESIVEDFDIWDVSIETHEVFIDLREEIF